MSSPAASPTKTPSPEDKPLLEDLKQRIRGGARWMGEQLCSFGKWAGANPGAVLLWIALFAVVGYFYMGVKAFQLLTQTPFQWMVAGWNSENDQEHCYFVIPGAILIALLRWKDLAAAPKEPSNHGLWLVGAGVLAYVASIRCMEGRHAIIALPLLIQGSVIFLRGKKAARILLFPSVFLLFMVPIGGVISSTVPLQTLTAKFIQAFSHLLGVPIVITGVYIDSANGSFERMKVIGGCSGIRSLMAMSTLTAVYAYYFMRTMTRGFILFVCSIVFAVFGNFIRVFSVVLFATYIDPKKALDHYHDFSGFIFFPAAVFLMVATGNLLNRDWAAMRKKLPTPPSSPGDSGSTSPTGEKKSAGPISYDY